MLHQFHDASTSATFTLSIGATTVERHVFKERQEPLLSIAWNRGAEQTL